jgi:small subunit ribosomal protein S17
MKKKNILFGKVISDKMDKTLVVLVEKKIKHFLYNKFVKRSTKYYVHDFYNKYKIGDTVGIFKTRPYSKMKSWAVI